MNGNIFSIFCGVVLSLFLQFKAFLISPGMSEAIKVIWFGMLGGAGGWAGKMIITYFWKWLIRISLRQWAANLFKKRKK
jgi:hypothetical protein